MEDKGYYSFVANKDKFSKNVKKIVPGDKTFIYFQEGNLEYLFTELNEVDPSDVSVL